MNNLYFGYESYIASFRMQFGIAVALQHLRNTSGFTQSTNFRTQQPLLKRIQLKKNQQQLKYNNNNLKHPEKRNANVGGKTKLVF